MASDALSIPKGPRRCKSELTGLVQDPKPGGGSLSKQSSWSPDADAIRGETWERRRKKKDNRGLTDDDVDEFKACLELGFGSDSPDVDPRLASAFPALGFYAALNSQYSGLSRSSSSFSLADDTDDQGNTTPLFDTDEDPDTMKAKLKRWAQVIACSITHLKVKQIDHGHGHGVVDSSPKK